MIKPPQSRFNENHNKLTVLSLENRLVSVYAQDISFHAYRVLDPACPAFAHVLYHRYDQNNHHRCLIMGTLRWLLLLSNSYTATVDENLRITYPHVAMSKQTNATSLRTLAELMRTPQLPSYFHQTAFLYCIHRRMAADPARWLVSLCIRHNDTNIGSFGYSNELPPPFIYMANSTANFNAFSDFRGYSADQLAHLSDLLSRMASDARDYDDIAVDFSVGSAARYRSFLKCIAFALVYPHPDIMAAVARVPELHHCSTPSELFHFFSKHVGIFNNAKNPLSDVVLSALVVAGPKRAHLAVSDTKELDASPTQTLSHSECLPNPPSDYFPHLRASKSYYHDHTVYILPKVSGLSRVAVSLEKINSRKHIVNIHVPDVATRIRPSSTLYDQLNTFVSSFRSVAPLACDQMWLVFHSRFIDDLSLSPTGSSGFLGVADLGDDVASAPPKEPKGPKTCMTVSFEYHTFAPNPLHAPADNVSVTFDNMDGIHVKELSLDELEQIVTGKLEPSILSPFKLFNRRHSLLQQQNQQQNLSPEDIHNVGFIYNVMKSHLKVRNLAGASTPNPAVIQRNATRHLRYSTQPGLESDIQTVVEVPGIDSAHANAMLMVNEILWFCGSLVSSFCLRERIPVIRTFQEILPEAEAGEAGEAAEAENSPGSSSGIPTSENSPAGRSPDLVYIAHESSIWPNYHGSQYHHTLFARDPNGYVSVAAKIVGNNFIGPSRYTVDSADYDVVHGLENGSVEVTSAVEDFRSYFNQLQMLAHCHQQKIHNADSFLQVVVANAPFKGLGFPVNGPLPLVYLDAQIQRVREADGASRWWSQWSRRYWALVSVEQQIARDEPVAFTCYVTRFTGDQDEVSKIATAWCVELAVEVDVVIETGLDLAIGACLCAHHIKHLDPIAGQCLMQ